MNDFDGLNWYEGKRVNHRCSVTVNRQPLAVRLDLRNHSPDGFNWGYNGSGPSQLALAILAHEYGDKVATAYYQEFREKVIARLVTDVWHLDTSIIDDLMSKIAGVDLDMASEEAQNVELNDH